MQLRQDKILLAFALDGRRVRIDWERLRMIKEVDFAKLKELKDKPFCLDAKLNHDIFQLDYSKFEELLAYIGGAPHYNQHKFKTE